MHDLPTSAFCPQQLVYMSLCPSDDVLGHFEQVTVLVCDAPDFLAMVSRCQPAEVVRCLDELFSSFDRLCSLHNVRLGADGSHWFWLCSRFLLDFRHAKYCRITARTVS